MIDTMIFDFNGTMFFDAKFQKDSWGQFIQQNFNRKMTELEFQQHIAGCNNRDTFEYYARRQITADELISMTTAKEKIYCDLCLSRPRDFHLVAGLPEFLDSCQDQRIQMNIATASEKPNVEFFFTYLELDRWFDIEQVALNDFSLPGKPAPDIFLKAIANVQATPATSVIFEDSISGIQAANRVDTGAIILVEDPHCVALTMPTNLRVDYQIYDYAQIGETITKN
ncbi:beta-phosphoglucomutase [Lactobacillus sp. CBA3606]|uniref:HAD family hydrolase n=1 Tax=Lactobacillus sp. CBA3606 TaxID=2099789 RepID=UPI000CFBC1C5|nr:HAD family phosphatase [Lactobacillus sp. CBA3606]AVK64055.1 beta-phosphoglucomutase [Lactobacillus sp. CBA3606]